MENVLPALIAERRHFGRAKVSVSAVVYGTMRLVPTRFPEDDIVRLFVAAFDAGITSFHVSPEYESYAGVCRALGRARSARPASTIEIVAKIAEPHFDQTSFDASRFRAKIERVLVDLDIETIDVVQWLVRHAPNDDAPRIAAVEAGSEALAGVWHELVSKGKVRALGSFPYSDAFLRVALSHACVDGVVSYYNERERELEPFFGELTASGRSVLGIRPLCAGAIRDTTGVAAAFSFALAPACVAGTIVGLSSEAHIETAARAAASFDRGGRFDAE